MDKYSTSLNFNLHVLFFFSTSTKAGEVYAQAYGYDPGCDGDPEHPQRMKKATTGDYCIHL